MDRQKTIDNVRKVSGIGLHTAQKVSMTFKPAGEDEGINFIRVDLPGKPLLKVNSATLLSQGRSPRRTSLGSGAAEIHTIEHLMAALSGLGIDNITIEMDSSEAPGLDGSSLKFVEELKKSGLRVQEKERRYFAIKEPILVEEDGASIFVFPDKDFKISYTLSYDHPLLKAQFLQLTVTAQMFTEQIAPARTFCLEDEATELQKQGVGWGANYENTLVMGKTGVIKNTLRFEDEFVRHKILDLMGDLYVLGQPIKGQVIALKSGHSLNMKLLQRIAQQKERYMTAGVGTTYATSLGAELDTGTIMKILPHRDPFLFVDKIIKLDPGKCAVGIKNVTINDYFFKGHFPQRPVMPGVLIVEALAQTGGVMMLAPQENRGKLAFFLMADKIKFRKNVIPGDQLVLEVTAGKIKAKTGQVFGKAMVDGKVVAEAELMFALVD